jgi:hypothetical protein
MEISRTKRTFLVWFSRLKNAIVLQVAGELSDEPKVHVLVFDRRRGRFVLDTKSCHIAWVIYLIAAIWKALYL